MGNKRRTLLPYPENILEVASLIYKDTPLSNEEINILKTRLDELIEMLPSRDKQIFIDRYKDKKTWETIGIKHNLSHDRVRQISINCFHIFRREINKENRDIYATKLTDFESMSTRTCTALSRGYITTIADILENKWTWDKIRSLRNFGPNGEHELRMLLEQYNIEIPET